MKKFNKLVRDRIPEIIKANNDGEPIIRILSGEDFIVELLKKLREETEELIQAKNDKLQIVKEIGDVYEVIDAIIDFYGLNRPEIINLKEKKKLNNGAFKKRIFLESVN